MDKLTDARKAELITYCKLDDLDVGEELLLESIYYSSLGYMEDAGVSEPAADTIRRARYDLCVNYLVNGCMDRRSPEVVGSVAENIAFRRMLNQMKLSEPVPE